MIKRENLLRPHPTLPGRANLCTQQQKNMRDPDRIALTMVAVREIIPLKSEITDPVAWFLLTDLPVNSFEEALTIIDIYKKDGILSSYSA